MNEKYKQFKKQIKHFFSRKSAKKELYNVTKVWIFIVAFSVTIAVILCIVAFYIFFFMYSDESLMKTKTDYKPPFKSDVLKDVVNKYRNRTSAFINEKNNLKSVPSVGSFGVKNEEGDVKNKNENEEMEVDGTVDILQ